MFFVGQRVGNKVVKRTVKISSGTWVYFTDGTAQFYN